MAKPIYKLVLIRGFTEAYFQLSDAKRAAFWSRVGEGASNVGATFITATYDCRWSNDKYSSFGIMEYPSAEAMVTETAELERTDFFRYVISETILGSPQEDEA